MQRCGGMQCAAIVILWQLLVLCCSLACEERVVPTSVLGATATPVWPKQFRALLFQNRTGSLALVQLYYDWRKQRNLNIVASQIGARGTVWDLEWGNGTSFIFSRDQPLCKVLHFDVGILTPDWLRNATHLGQDTVDGFAVDAWTKADFLTYYTTVDAQQPVMWYFHQSNAKFHVMQWQAGATLEERDWQAPPYCFNNQSATGDWEFWQRMATGDLFRMPHPDAGTAREAAAQ